MKSFSFVMTIPIFVHRKNKRRRTRSSSQLRRKDDVRSSGALQALTSVSHGRSQISTLSGGQPSAQVRQSSKNRSRTPMRGQSTTVLAARPGIGESGDKDYLYDEIMRRVGVPLKDLR